MKALVFLLLASPALAAPTPLSALPAAPARYFQAPGPVHVAPDPDAVHFTGSESVCLLSDTPPYWIDGDAYIKPRARALPLSTVAFGVERLVSRGDSAELERISITVEDSGPVPLARSRIPLHVVARLEHLDVYAYRWQSKVFLLARSVGTPTLREADTPVLQLAPECRVIMTMLRVHDGSSEVVQLQGLVPTTGKPYLIDASVSQTSRDPEPLLSVTARLLAPRLRGPVSGAL